MVQCIHQILTMSTLMDSKHGTIIWRLFLAEQCKITVYPDCTPVFRIWLFSFVKKIYKFFAESKIIFSWRFCELLVIYVCLHTPVLSSLLLLEERVKQCPNLMLCEKRYQWKYGNYRPNKISSFHVLIIYNWKLFTNFPKIIFIL